MVAARIQCQPAPEPFPIGPADKLSPSHHALAVALRKGEAAPPGSPARGFLGLVRAANQNLDPPLSIRDLPLEVAQAILDGRAKTMEEFFRSWAESIAQNAAADKEAALRAHRDQDELKRSETARRSTAIFAAALCRARNMGKVSHASGEALADRAGLPRLCSQGRAVAGKTTHASVNRWSPVPDPPR